MKTLDTLAVLLYNITILGGTAYLVQVYNWNPWWFLLSIGVLATKIFKEDEK